MISRAEVVGGDGIQASPGLVELHCLHRMPLLPLILSQGQARTSSAVWSPAQTATLIMARVAALSAHRQSQNPRWYHLGAVVVVPGAMALG